MKNQLWQFWIDVGGTFTDCIACPPNPKSEFLQRHKLLSSAITPGLIEHVEGNVLYDHRRQQDPPAFWNGAQLRVLDCDGQLIFESPIAESQEASLQLESEFVLPAEYGSTGLRYEIHTPLEAPLIAIHYLLGVPLTDSLPPVSLRLGTTRGTNALLTRTGARTLFVTTAGFGDILHIGNQDRPELFTLNIQKPHPLFESTFEVQERIDTNGEVLEPLQIPLAREAFQQARQTGIQSIAICLMNSYTNDIHEQALKTLANELGFKDVSISSEVSPLIKLVSRADTTVLNSYLNPVLTDYLNDIRQQLHPDSSIRFMTSSGGLIPADLFSGKDSILSGPAGGVVGFSHVAKQAGFQKAIGFDMGGTSTDVSRYDGQFEYEYETQKAGVRIVTPMLAIETVAAGGGSICSFDGVKLTVGPQSAGSHPGPACYGQQGPLTVTDLNLILGRILPQQFSIPLYPDAAIARLEALITEIHEATGHEYQLHDLAEAFLTIANHNMAQAISNISVAKGYNPAEYTLVNFGGAASQHVCQVAQLLGMTKILNHPDAGILSAYGIGHANISRQTNFGVYKPLTQSVLDDLQSPFKKASDTLIDLVLNEGIEHQNIHVRVLAEVRPQGIDATLTVELIAGISNELIWSVDVDGLQHRFQSAHQRRYGFTSDTELELVTLRLEATGQTNPPETSMENPPLGDKPPTEPASIYYQGKFHDACVYSRRTLQSGDLISGPAIITEAVSTTVIDPDWTAEVLPDGMIVLNKSRDASDPQEVRNTTNSDPALLEIYNNQFASIADQMGLTLQNTSSSVNVKERLDFSCAIFTASGGLVVNAPHIPVHLGAMGEAVRAVIEDHHQIQPGDVFITNDPYRGGSHLPDITVITPVFNSQHERLFFTASRAHHSELGGITPGSMPPFSKSLAEEGVLIRSQKIVNAGQSEEIPLRALLGNSAYPSRSIDANIADINAQIAANRQGADDLQRMIQRRGENNVLRYMDLIQQAAAARTRQTIRDLPDGVYQYEDVLDEHFTEPYEAKLCVTVTIEGDTATIDFTGTSDVLPINLNANRAIVTAAVIYVLRLLINQPIPLNQGVLDPITLVLPPCLLNPNAGPTASDSPAVVGGNVETSQRIVDVLIGALQLSAASQGTMNNLLFGDETFGYYETICGGAGATALAHGADAVHTHMTNTRITDPEILEQRYPVRLDQFSIRSGSGGRGIKHGGNGIIRKMTFLKSVTVSLLTQRRHSNAPPGIQGGLPGKPGLNLLTQSDGRQQTISNRQQLSVMPGDQLTLETPGGGGWGKP